MGSATSGDTTVLVGTNRDTAADGAELRGPGIWFSRDGLHWEAADVPGAGNESLEIRDVTVGGPGFVAVGDDHGDRVSAAVWTSVDGTAWDRVSDAGFSPGRMWHVGATDKGLVAFGDDCRCIYGDDRSVIWTSENGLDWLRATNESGLEVADGVRELVAHDGNLTAFVDPVFREEVRPSVPFEVWQTSGRAEWEQVGVLPGSEDSEVYAAAAGPRGWVALGARMNPNGPGEPLAWTSSDGVAWERAPTAPLHAYQVIADTAGFIAVGGRETVKGCSIPDWAVFGETWTSSDGRTWRKMPDQPEFDGASIGQLVQRDRMLYGVGRAHSEDAASTTVVWTTTPPADSVDSGTAPSPTPTPEPNQGCGPA